MLCACHSDPMSEDTTITVFDTVRALAFIGDLSMGQPVDHSLRTAWLAGMIATQAGCDAPQVEAVRHVALLRWSGCTANAQEFSDLLEDDVLGRRALLASPEPRLRRPQHTPVPAGVVAMADIHCEIAGDIANTLGLGPGTEAALRAMFEAYDGSGIPGILRGDEVPLATCIVSLASDLEIFGRLYGLDQALALARGTRRRRLPRLPRRRQRAASAAMDGAARCTRCALDRCGRPTAFDAPARGARTRGRRDRPQAPVDDGVLAPCGQPGARLQRPAGWTKRCATAPTRPD
jgi:hypothetical protein